MYGSDPKHLEMKKHLLLSLKKEGRSRHADRLKTRFAPPTPAQDVPVPGMDASQAPAEPNDGAGDEMTKEKLVELLSMLK